MQIYPLPFYYQQLNQLLLSSSSLSSLSISATSTSSVSPSTSSANDATFSHGYPTGSIPPLSTHTDSLIPSSYLSSASIFRPTSGPTAVITSDRSDICDELVSSQPINIYGTSKDLRQSTEKQSYWSSSYEELLCHHAEIVAAKELSVTSEAYVRYTEHRHRHPWLSPDELIDAKSGHAKSNRGSEPLVSNSQRWHCRLPIAITCAVIIDETNNSSTSSKIYKDLKMQYDVWYVNSVGSTKKEAQYRSARAAMYVLDMTNIDLER